jgi:DNA modification methylase
MKDKANTNLAQGCTNQVVERVEISLLKLPPRRLRKHSQKQLRKIERLLEEMGQAVPILVTETYEIVHGEAQTDAARQLGWTHVKVLRVEGLSDEHIRQLRIAIIRIEEDAEWNLEEVKHEFGELLIEFPGLDLTLTGFETPELDIILGDQPESEEQDVVCLPAAGQIPTSIQGDLWQLRDHAVITGSARESTSHKALLGGAQVRLVVTDPPYNVAVKGHIGGKGAIQHREFVEASGEFTDPEFDSFIRDSLGCTTPHLCSGGLAYIFMDWRQIRLLIKAGEDIVGALLNLCIWVKTNGGMGSFYRSQHELIAIFKHGSAPCLNNIELGRHGRNRTNVWTYAGVNTFRAGRLEELALHPTVKPVEMIVDIILDCTKRGDLILDPFLGSGTALIAAERTGRRCRAIELDPLYVDTAIRRWQDFTGEKAVLLETGETFDEVSERRKSGQ